MSTTRRRFLTSSSLLLAGAAAVGPAGALAAAPPDDEPCLVFAHLTDMHIKPTGAGPEGLKRCLQHLLAHPAKPSFIVNGGDSIMSALGAKEESVRAQWEQFHAIVDSFELPRMVHLIGNHDCWGWQRSKAGTTGDEPLYGKAWVMQELGLERGYQTFDEAGWRFILLDSVQERGDGGYLPMLDEEQFAWFEATLESTPDDMPTLIASHVPILGVAPFFFYDDIVKEYQFRVAGALMHQDVHRIVKMLRRFPQVHLCMSGHVHIVDQVAFEGRAYLNNGAVSGSWWHGPYQGCPAGYAIVKLWGDGRFEREYVVYDEGVDTEPPAETLAAPPAETPNP